MISHVKCREVRFVWLVVLAASLGRTLASRTGSDTGSDPITASRTSRDGVLFLKSNAITDCGVSNADIEHNNEQEEKTPPEIGRHGELPAELDAGRVRLKRTANTQADSSSRIVGFLDERHIRRRRRRRRQTGGLVLQGLIPRRVRRQAPGDSAMLPGAEGEVPRRVRRQAPGQNLMTPEEERIILQKHNERRRSEVRAEGVADMQLMVRVSSHSNKEVVVPDTNQLGPHSFSSFGKHFKILHDVLRSKSDRVSLKICHVSRTKRFGSQIQQDTVSRHFSSRLM